MPSSLQRHSTHLCTSPTQPYGIIRTPWAQWIKQAIAANYHVGLLPIDAKMSAAFSEDTFWAFFNKVEFMPYGYHTFMQSFLDTYPMKNLPQPIVTETFQLVLEAMDRLLNNSGTGVNVYSLFVEGLNHRLNASCTDLKCIEALLDATGSNLGAATAIPEVDGWLYDKGQNYSMVCSEFAAHVWKTGVGSFWPHLQAGEQTPKDNYQMGIYDPSFFTATNCPGGLQTTPQGTYCQLMGEYTLTLPGYNSIAVYEDINNHCSAQWPGYTRGPANC